MSGWCLELDNSQIWLFVEFMDYTIIMMIYDRAIGGSNGEIHLKVCFFTQKKSVISGSRPLREVPLCNYWEKES